MPNTKTPNDVKAAQARLDDLTQSLEALNAASEATRAGLGVAVADGDREEVIRLRAEIDRQGAHRQELEAAIPVATERLQEADERAKAAQAIEDAKEANAARVKRLEAARKLDAALRALSRAHDEHMACEPGGTTKDRNAILSRLQRHYRIALYKWHPGLAHFLAKALNSPRVHQQDARSLEDSEASTITEFDIDAA